MLSKILARVFKTERNQNQERPTAFKEENSFFRKYPTHRWYVNYDSEERNGYFNKRENRGRPSWTAYPSNNNHTTYNQTYENYKRNFETNRNKQLSRIEQPNSSHALENSISKYGTGRIRQSELVAYPNNNHVQKCFIRTFDTRGSRQPLWTAHLNSNQTSKTYSKNYETRVNRRLPISRIHPNNNHIQEQCSMLGDTYKYRQKPQESQCLSERRINSGFCKKKASHLSRDCNIKERLKQAYIEQNISQFGVGAELLTRDRISQGGIKDVTDSQFKQMPILHPQGNRSQSQAGRKLTCNLCKCNIEHKYTEKKYVNQIKKTFKEPSTVMPSLKTYREIRDNNLHPVPALNSTISNRPYMLKNNTIKKMPSQTNGRLLKHKKQESNKAPSRDRRQSI